MHFALLARSATWTGSGLVDARPWRSPSCCRVRIHAWGRPARCTPRSPASTVHDVTEPHFEALSTQSDSEFSTSWSTTAAPTPSIERVPT